MRWLIPFFTVALLAPAQDLQDGLLISGRRESGRWALDTAFAGAFPAPRLAPGGTYQLRGLDTRGRAIFLLPFELAEIADSPSASAGFSAFAPLPLERLEALRALQILQNGKVLFSRRRSGRIPALSVSAQRHPDGVHLDWSPRSFTHVMVRDPKTRQVLGILQGGKGTITTEAGSLEILASDGIRGRRHLLLLDPQSPTQQN